MHAPDQDGRWGTNYSDVIGNTYHRNRVKIAMRLLRVMPLQSARVFDFGCGEGVLMRTLAKAGASVVGCDKDQENELIARAPEGAFRGGIEYLEAEPDATLDALVALNVLSYLTPDELARFWVAARRTVKPGGLLLHTVPNKFGSKPNRDHFWVENPETYPAKLQTLGFVEIDRAFNGYYGRIFRWHLLSAVLGWGKIADRLGIWSRGGRVYHPWRLALAPESWRMRRSTGYYSLARRLSREDG